MRNLATTRQLTLWRQRRRVIPSVRPRPHLDFMAHGFFTIEQWRDKRWMSVCHIDGHQSLTEAMQELERRGKPGFFRVVQTQRMVWAEKTDGKLKLRRWHASSPETLSRTAEAFDRDGGKWPESQ